MSEFNKFYNKVKDKWTEFTLSSQMDKITEGVAERLGERSQEKEFKYDIEYILNYDEIDDDREDILLYSGHYLLISIQAFAVKYTIDIENISFDPKYVEDIFSELSDIFADALKSNIDKLYKKPGLKGLFDPDKIYLIKANINEIEELDPETTETTEAVKDKKITNVYETYSSSCKIYFEHRDKYDRF